MQPSKSNETKRARKPKPSQWSSDPKFDEQRDRVLSARNEQNESPKRFYSFTNAEGKNNVSGLTREQARELRRIIMRAATNPTESAIQSARAGSFTASSYLFSTKNLNVTKSPFEVPLDIEMSSTYTVANNYTQVLLTTDPSLPQYGIKVYGWNNAWFLEKIVYPSLQPEEYGNTMSSNLARLKVVSDTISSTNSTLSGTVRAMVFHSINPVTVSPDVMYTQSTSEQRTDLIKLQTGAMACVPYVMQQDLPLSIGIDPTNENLINLCTSRNREAFAYTGTYTVDTGVRSIIGYGSNSYMYFVVRVSGYPKEILATLPNPTLTFYVYTRQVGMPTVTTYHTAPLIYNSSVQPAASSFSTSYSYSLIVPSNSVYEGYKVYGGCATMYNFSVEVDVYTQTSTEVSKPWPVLLVQGVSNGMQLSIEGYANVSVLPDEQIPFNGSMRNSVDSQEASTTVRDYLRAGGSFVKAGESDEIPHAYSFRNFTSDITTAIRGGRQIARELKPVIQELKPYISQIRK